MLNRKSFFVPFLFVLALSSQHALEAAKYYAEIVHKGSVAIPLQPKETEEVPLVNPFESKRECWESFHTGIRDAMLRGHTPLFTNHDTIHTLEDQGNLFLWRWLEKQIFSPVGQPIGPIPGDAKMFVRTLRKKEYYQKKPYYGGDAVSYCSRMPYFSTSLVCPSDAEFYTSDGERSTGFILTVPAKNILVASGRDFDSGLAEDYLNCRDRKLQDVTHNVERFLTMGVDSPDDCLAKILSKKYKYSYEFIHNEILIQPEVPGGSVCLITGAFVLENSSDPSTWQPQSREFYDWATKKGLSVVRFFNPNWLQDELSVLLKDDD